MGERFKVEGGERAIKEGCKSREGGEDRAGRQGD